MNAFVRDVMTAKVVTAEKDTTFEAIAAALRQHRISAVPVVDGESRVVGVVSESDLLAKLALGIDEDRMPGATGILAGEPHEEHRPFDVSVQSGVVTMFGMPLAAEQGYRMIRQARHVQGVVAVRDRLDYPLPRPSAYDALAGFPVD